MFDVQKLKDLRLSAGESQAAVAAILNVTQQAYANYESGKRKPDIMVVSKLAKHFDIMISDFFTDEDIEKPASFKADGPEIHPAYFHLSPEDRAVVNAMIDRLADK